MRCFYYVGSTYAMHINTPWFLKDLMSTYLAEFMIAWYASSHSFRKAVDYYSYTTAYTVVGIASLISSEHNYQDDSCTNHSLVTWPACFRPDLNPDLLRGRQVLIPLCHPTNLIGRSNQKTHKVKIKYFFQLEGTKNENAQYKEQ